MIKILNISKSLIDVAVCEEDGKIRIYSYQETPCADRFEERQIREKLETAYKIKFEKDEAYIEEEKKDNDPLNNLPRI